jgi:hypothetical protein
MSISRILQYLLLLLGSFFAHALPLAPASAQNSIDIEFKDNGQTARTLPRTYCLSQGDEQCQAYSGKSIRVFFTFKSENVTSSTIFALTG